MRMVVDIELSLDYEDFIKFKDLAEELNTPIPDLMLRCMFEKRDELFDTFEHNVPEVEN